MPTSNGSRRCSIYAHNRILSAMKKSEILTFAATWMDLEDIVQILNKTEKDSYHVISLICGILKRNDQT